jgi:hypothetical protein
MSNFFKPFYASTPFTSRIDEIAPMQIRVLKEDVISSIEE